MPALTGILETALYVGDVPRAVEFYRRLFDFPLMVGDQRFAALAVENRQVLLFFLEGGAREPLALSGGIIPPHGGSGQMHMAFSVPAASLPEWEQRLKEHGIAIESRVTWERGGVSIYFRDPDQHLIELVTPGCWAIY
jgi:catechol 2,3-dioxygenase-like lactoylglutathione lyase family enzyme